MIIYTHSTLHQVAVHHIGSINDKEDMHLSKDTADTSDRRVREFLFAYFLNPFINAEYYNFTFSNKDFTLNPLYKFATRIFEDPKRLLHHSCDIAQHLYELSVHPQIKPGDLFVAYFTNIEVEGEITDAIGLFKCEHRQPFLKLNAQSENYALHYEEGMQMEKLDKGCLIFNTAVENGLKVCIVDRANKNAEAQYWKDSFLQLRPCSDNYHHTKEFMNLTKSYVTQQMPADFEISKADQIDLLNRSVDYFKTHENFEKNDFERTVLQDTGLIKSFRTYDDQYRRQNELEMPDSFDVSGSAVKKQTRVFKSVLKLDRNFHIYIHGNRELIEKGVDDQGRKFYKIYFNEEA